MAARRSTSSRATAAFDFEIRHLPLDDPEAFAADVEAFAREFLAADARGAPRYAHRVRPAFHAARHGHADGSEIAALAHACNGDADVGKVSFGTEASLFHGSDIADGDLRTRPHRAGAPADEWVAIDQLARCEAFMRRLADRICSR